MPSLAIATEYLTAFLLFVSDFLLCLVPHSLGQTRSSTTTLRMKTLLFVCGLLFCLVTSVQGQTGANAKALRKKIFVTDEYDKNVRPVNEQGESIHVYVSFTLLSINDLDEVSETLKTTGFLEIQWQDDYLVWTPASYGGLTTYFFPQKEVWTPDVALQNSILQYKQLGVDTLNVRAEATGGVLWYPFQVFESTCDIDITYFPFDVQTCRLVFVAWSYTKNEVYMHSGAKGIDLSRFEANSAWDVVDSSWEVKDETEEASVIFTLKMKRKPQYVILSILIPILTLALLNVFTFVLPSGCGEKSSYAITVFLAFVVFLTIVDSILPNSSENVSIFSVYVLLLTIQSTFITILSIVSIRIASINDRPVPRFLVALAGLGQCRSCRRQGGGQKANQVTDGVSPEEPTVKEQADRDNEPTWKSVANDLDMILFILFFAFLIISTFTCIIISTES